MSEKKEKKKRTFTEAGYEFTVINISHNLNYFCHAPLVRATFVQVPQLSDRAQTCNFYNCGHINQSHSRDSLLTCRFIGINFINLKNLWCVYLPCDFEVPKDIYNVHRWPYPLKLAIAGKTQCIKAPQCHKAPRCRQLDQASEILQNDLCLRCLLWGCSLDVHLFLGGTLQQTSLWI